MAFKRARMNSERRAELEEQLRAFNQYPPDEARMIKLEMLSVVALRFEEHGDVPDDIEELRERVKRGTL